MGKKNDDIPGKRFGRLTLAQVIPARKNLETGRWRSKKYVCSCDCGEIVEVFSTNVLRGRTTSCGCAQRESRAARATHGESRGGKMSPLYQAWNSMMTRCYNPKSNRSHRYRERGIKVCEHWHTPDNFFKDMGPHPGQGFSLDRIDNDKGYSPENCKWSTAREQGYNTSTNVRAGGKTLIEWERETGLPARLLRGRLKRGWDLQRALSTPKRLREECHG